VSEVTEATKSAWLPAAGPAGGGGVVVVDEAGGGGSSAAVRFLAEFDEQAASEMLPARG
jgi:hypothetical protein